MQTRVFLGEACIPLNLGLMLEVTIVFSFQRISLAEIASNIPSVQAQATSVILGHLLGILMQRW